MTSREIIRRTLDFDFPERVAHSFEKSDMLFVNCDVDTHATNWKKLDTLAFYQEGAKITFWCPVDVQKTLQTQNEQIIRAKAREMLDKLWQGRGGFIAGYYTDNTSIGLEPKWQGHACDEFLKYGQRYKEDTAWQTQN